MTKLEKLLKALKGIARIIRLQLIGESQQEKKFGNNPYAINRELAHETDKKIR